MARSGTDAAPGDEGSQQRRGALLGLAAAGLFGASAPLAKRLLPGVTPVMLAGLLYGGAGLALAGWGLARRRSRAPKAPGIVVKGAPSAEAALRRTDAATLVAIVLLGGVVGPICMLWGLARLSGISGALLLNLESPLTALLAVLLFREHLGGRSALAILVIVGAAALLGIADPSAASSAVDAGGDAGGDAALPALAIGAACLAWAIDNNLTQRLSVRDPLAVVRIKALGAAGCNLALALATGSPLPGRGLLIAALAVGAASYGVSVVLDFQALRILGAAREAAFFATAPFAGALLAIPLLGQRPGLRELAAAVAMAAGVVMLLRDRHGHPHTHEALEHDHLHVHDQHHQHFHDHLHTPGAVAPGQPHAHPHRHEPITHEHPHTSDIHHRHRH